MEKTDSVVVLQPTDLVQRIDGELSGTDKDRIALAKSLKVESSETCIEAKEVYKYLKGRMKSEKQRLDMICGGFHSAWKKACEFREKILSPYLSASDDVSGKILMYDEAEELKRLEKERVLQAEAQKQADDNQLSEAEHLQSSGDPEAAEALLNEDPAVAQVVVQKEQSQVKGVSSRGNWYARVTSPAELLKAVAEGKVPAQAMIPNMVFLNQQARSLQSAMNWPGVVSEKKTSLAG